MTVQEHSQLLPYCFPLLLASVSMQKPVVYSVPSITESKDRFQYLNEININLMFNKELL